jgi:hypothetical protein
MAPDKARGASECNEGTAGHGDRAEAQKPPELTAPPIPSFLLSRYSSDLPRAPGGSSLGRGGRTSGSPLTYARKLPVAIGHPRIAKPIFYRHNIAVVVQGRPATAGKKRPPARPRPPADKKETSQIMRVTLTDALLRSIKPPTSGRLQISDTRAPGLLLRITDRGVYSWCFRCHDPNAGKATARVTLGPYPTVSLAEARERASAMRKQVLDGSPIESKPTARASAQSKTFGHLAQRYLDEHVHRRRLKSAAAIERRLRLHVLPAWGDRRFDGITRADVVERLEQIVLAGKGPQANRVQTIISGIFSFAVDAGLLPFNPCNRLRKRGIEAPATRVLSDGELRLFWRGAMALPPHLGLALRLQLLTGTRGGEVAGIEMGELEHLDKPSKARWLIPPGRTKNGKA